MSLPGLRRVLAARPRAVLVVLLAFGVEIFPMPAAFVSHRHASGGLSHSHSGRIVGAIPMRLADETGAGIRVGAASDLHRHAVQPLVLTHVPRDRSLAPSLLVASIPASPRETSRSAAPRSAQSRGPPLRA